MPIGTWFVRRPRDGSTKWVPIFFMSGRIEFLIDSISMFLHKDTILRTPSFDSCILDLSQNTNLPPPSSYRPMIHPRSSVSIVFCSFANQFLPWHKINFTMLPLSHLKPLLDAQPWFLLSPLLKNLKKQPRHLGGGAKVNALAEISIFMCIK
jgi:hypothetical protein